MRPGKDDQFLLSQSQADADKSFCTPPLRRAELMELIKGAPHRLIPRCVITQGSGKQRIIANADTGGQSSSESNTKLVLCSPLRPAQHIAEVLRRMPPDAVNAALQSDSWETGGEDWPDAYRHSPMHPQEALGCVVTFWHHEWEEACFLACRWLLPPSSGTGGWLRRLGGAYSLSWSACTSTMLLSQIGHLARVPANGPLMSSTSCSAPRSQRPRISQWMCPAFSWASIMT